MPEKMKLSLDDLEVQSFVTSLNETMQHEIKGGIQSKNLDDCHTFDAAVPGCDTGGDSAICTVDCHTGGQCTV